MFSIKKLYLFFLTAFLFLTLSRTFTVLFLTEAKTGFLIGSSKLVAIILFVICLFVLLVLAFAAFMCEKKPIFTAKPSFVTAVWCFAVAVAILADIATGFNTSFLFFSCLRALFGLLSAATFVLYGLYYFNKAKFFGVFFAPVVLFFVFKTVEVFTNYSVLAVICDHVFEIIILCLFMLFFLGYAKIQSNIKIKSKRVWVVLGFVASCVAISYQISNYICLLSGGGAALHGQNTVSWAITTLSVFILLTINDMCEKGSVVVEEQK